MKVNLRDSADPVRGRSHGKEKSKRVIRENVMAHRFEDIEMRFIYEGELKGEWYLVATSFLLLEQGLSFYPNSEHKVIRVEFRDVSEV